MRYHVQLGFGFIMLLIVMGAGAVLYQSHNNNKIITELVEVSNAKVRHVMAMRDAIRQRVNFLSIIVTNEDPFERDEKIMQFYSYATLFVTARKKLEALPMNKEEKKYHNEIRKAIKHVQPYSDNIIEMASSYVVSERELIKTAKIAHSKREPLFNALNTLVTLQQRYSQEALKQSRELNEHTNSITIVVTLLILLAALATAIFVTRTVSRQKEKLVMAYEVAQAATRSKSAFLANMSHEIRTPITAMIGFAESTFFSDQTEETRQRSVKTIIESGRHLLQIVNDVLDISKIESDKLEVEILPCSIFSVVSGAETILKNMAQKKSIELKVNYRFPMPVEVKTDPVRLKQILINLGSNAIKFTEQGHVHINVEYELSNNKLYITVVDTGIGLTKKQMKEIFEPFKQADVSTSRKYGGTGLGLTLSKQLANALGGDITVTSDVGKGSRFVISVAASVGVNAQFTNEEIVSTETEQRLSEMTSVDDIKVSGKVLVAEDNIVNQQLLIVFLKRIGVDYKIVDNGKLAVAEAQAGDYDLIIMDLQMPEMDGITATRTLKEAGYDKPIIALTANTSEEDRKNCLEAGCADFLTKPIDIMTFFKAVAEHLNGETPKFDADAPIYSTFSLDGPEVTGLVEGFVKIHMPVMLREIEKALHKQDWDTTRHKLHELKGVASNVGYLDLAEQAKTMESMVDSENEKELAKQMKQINTLADRITAGIKNQAANNIKEQGIQ